jgi:hypothetical protein
MTVKVIDVRHADNAREGQQKQTHIAAEQALTDIEGASAVLVISFVPNDDGKFTVDVAVAGSGPDHFGAVVRDTLHGAAELVSVGLERQAAQWAERGKS